MKHNFFLVIYILLDIYPFFFLRYAPFKDKYVIKFKYVILILSLLTVVQTVGFVWLNNVNGIDSSVIMLYRQAWAGAFFGLSLVFIRDNFFKLLYVWLMVLSYDYVIIGLSKYLSVFVFNTGTPLYTDILIRLLELAVSYPPILFFMSRTMRETANVDNKKIWRYLWIIPGIFNVLNVVTLIDEEKTFEINTIFIAQRLLMLLGCLFTTFIMLKTVSALRTQRDYEENIRAVENQLTAEREQYKLINRHMEETRVQRHDFRHHVAVITSLAEQGDLAGLQEYIAGYNKSTNLDAPVAYCKSYALNSLLCYYESIARNDAIRCEISLSSFPEYSVTDADLCVIFGNLFENAIEACRYVKREERFILIKSAIIGGMVSVLIENSFDGTSYDENDKYISRKRMGEHGLGLSSVNALTDRLGGTLVIISEPPCFTVSILLPCRSSEEDKQISRS